MSDVLDGVGTVNVGLSTFADALRAQDAPVVEVDWRPPAGGAPRAVAAAAPRAGGPGARHPPGHAPPPPPATASPRPTPTRSPGSRARRRAR